MADTNRAPLSDWQTITVRLTTFHDTIDPALLEPLYKNVIGEEPENIVKRRDVFQADGMFKSGHMILAVPTLSVPRRIDWIYTSSEDVATFGSFDETLAIFRDLMTLWLRDCPPVKRLALGAILILPVTDKESGYRQLAAYLPSLTINAAGSSDLLYQINRPRPSKGPIEGLIINRLSKWQVTIAGRVQVGIVGEAPQLFHEHSSVRCQVELDLNTSQLFPGILASERLVPLLDELGQLAKEILKNGDIP